MVQIQVHVADLEPQMAFTLVMPGFKPHVFKPKEISQRVVKIDKGALWNIDIHYTSGRVYVSNRTFDTLFDVFL